MPQPSPFNHGIARLIRLSGAIALSLLFLTGLGFPQSIPPANAVEPFSTPPIYGITHEVASTGALTPADFQQVAAQGFQAVLNLRFEQENGFLVDEADRVAATGMAYANVPIKPTELNDEGVDQVFKTIDALPKPVLVHCSTGHRATGMALLYQERQSPVTAEQFFQQAGELGITMGDRPTLQQFFADYLTQHLYRHPGEG